MTRRDREALASVERYFDGAHLERPRAREGAVERMERGFEPKHERVLERLLDHPPAAQCRIDYRALSRTCLGELTPYALDDHINVADISTS